MHEIRGGPFQAAAVNIAASRDRYSACPSRLFVRLDFALIQDQKLKSMLVKLDANLEAVRSLLNYFRDTNNSL